MDRKNFSLRGSIWLLGVLLLSSLTFLLAARLDPEPYHDGAQVAPATAVSEGLAVNYQAFDSYGPITAWLQAFAMKFFGSTVLTARITTAILLIVVSALIFIIGRRVLHSNLGAAVLAGSWVVMWPGQAVIWGTPLLPWPSVTFLLLQLIALLLLLRLGEVERGKSWLTGLLGLVIALASITRPNYGLPLALTSFLLLIFMRSSFHMDRARWRNFALGLVVGFGSVLVVLISTVSLEPFLNQALLGPLRGDASANITPWLYLKSAYFWGSLPLAIALAAGLVVVRTRSIAGSAQKLLLILIGICVFAWATTAVEGSPLRQLILSHLTWSPALDGQAQQPLYFSVLVTLVATVVLLIGSIPRLLDRISKGPRTQASTIRHVDPMTVMMVVLALASLIQLIPIADPNHLWWSAPIPLLLICLVIRRFCPTREAIRVVALMTVPFLFLSIWTSHTYLSAVRTEIKTGSLSGMLIRDQYADSVASVGHLLVDLPPRSTRFLCDQGLFATWNGRFLSDSPAYVQWAFALEGSEAPPPLNNVIFCSDPGSEELASQYAQSHNLEIVAVAPRVTLSYFTSVTMTRMRAK